MLRLFRNPVNGETPNGNGEFVVADYKGLIGERIEEGIIFESKDGEPVGRLQRDSGGKARLYVYVSNYLNSERLSFSDINTFGFGLKTNDITGIYDWHLIDENYMPKDYHVMKKNIDTMSGSIDRALEWIDNGVDYISAPYYAEPGQALVVSSVDESGRPTSWETAYVSGGGGGGGSTTIVQSDWSVNDESSETYVKNRTHWVENNGDFVLPEISPTYSDGNFIITTEFELIAGELYTVYWNGIGYNCVATSANLDGIKIVYLGNGGAVDSGYPTTNDPFVVAAVPPEMGFYGMAIPLDGCKYLTLSITNEVVHKLDNKFLNLDWLPVRAVDIIPEYTGVVEALSEEAYGMEIPDTAGILSTIENGTSVTMEVNGASYEVTKSTDMDGCYLAEPSGTFLIMAVNPNTNAFVITTEPGEYTVRVIGKNTNKIPKDFLPDDMQPRTHWVEGSMGLPECNPDFDKNPAELQRSSEEKARDWEFTAKMACIIKDLMNGNPNLPEGAEEEMVGHNAIAAGFQGQRQWTDFYPNCDFPEALLNSSFDHNGAREPYILATENDVLNGIGMLFMKLLTGRAQMFSDVRTFWSPEACK